MVYVKPTMNFVAINPKIATEITSDYEVPQPSPLRRGVELLIQVTIEVFAQRLRRGITADRIVLQGLQYNGIEIAG